MVHNYDAILIAIAAAIVGGALLGVFSPIAVELGVFIGVAIATPFVGYALFVNPPVSAGHPFFPGVAIGWLGLIGLAGLIAIL